DDADLAEPVPRRDVVAGVEQDGLVTRADDPVVVIHLEIAVRLPVLLVVVEHHALAGDPLPVLHLDDAQPRIRHGNSLAVEIAYVVGPTIGLSDNHWQ